MKLNVAMGVLLSETYLVDLGLWWALRFVLPVYKFMRLLRLLCSICSAEGIEVNLRRYDGGSIVVQSS